MEYLAVAIVLLIVSALVTTLAMSGNRPQDAKANVLADFNFPQFQEGTPQAVIFGDVWSGDWMVLWYGDFGVDPIKGKGGKK